MSRFARLSSVSEYELVKLANGTFSVKATAEDETFHPVIGPAAEAQALYVRQLHLPGRIAKHPGEFVIWDVGLGAAANVLTVFAATKDVKCSLRVISFDRTIQPLEFAVTHARELGYVVGFEKLIGDLLASGKSKATNGTQSIDWELRVGDFPEWAAKEATTKTVPTPDAVLFDPFSLAKNPAMWSPHLFSNLFGLLDPKQPCAMPTYSRSTMLRVTLLLAGFYVGAGHATGEKEETTIAANTLSLLSEPLGFEWLRRARISGSAEPMWDGVYRQVPLSHASWEKLIKHPQFASLANQP
jgi:tRNA U34 5-methylaminomethyl-2-thiouridine-forming methyltransferase MnmC